MLDRPPTRWRSRPWHLAYFATGPKVMVTKFSSKPGAIRKRRHDQKMRLQKLDEQLGLDPYSFKLPTAELKTAMRIRAYVGAKKEDDLTYEDLKNCIYSETDFTHQQVEERVGKIIDWWWKRWMERRNALLKKLKP